MKKVDVNGWTRISNAAARKRFNAVEPVRLVPKNFIPESVWGYAADISYGGIC